ncbi:MAG: Arm DNA-binding domain-containing protein, partial [Bacteroidia bacterium]
SGKKYWRFRYTLLSGRERVIAYGRYPEISLLEARNWRLEQSRLVQKGLDPLILKEEEKQLAKYKDAQTLRFISYEWIERN